MKMFKLTELVVYHYLKCVNHIKNKKRRLYVLNVEKMEVLIRLDLAHSISNMSFFTLKVLKAEERSRTVLNEDPGTDCNIIRTGQK